MVPPYLKRLPPRPAAAGIAAGIAQGREPTPDDIEGYLNTISGSHRTMGAAREAIAMADKVLARRLSERR